jgi:hypothetical protein
MRRDQEQTQKPYEGKNGDQPLTESDLLIETPYFVHCD